MRVLIGYNGSDFSKAALDDLLHAGLPDHVEALVITVAEVCLPPENLLDAAKLSAEAAEKLQRSFPNWSVLAETAYGSPAREILARAESFRPDLIVVGERRQSLSERNIFLGHASQTILTEAGCSVRIARGRLGEATHPQRIVVGFDGSAGSEYAVSAIASRNWPKGSTVRLVSVADSSVLGSIGRFVPQMNDAVLEAKFASQWAETLAADSVRKLTNAGLAASIEVRMGHPKDTIIEVAESTGADSIFVGPHCSGNSFERFLLGSVSAAVAARAHCSVEVVRKKG
jgi:nucleotide-binding universal stress UspA family protein